MKIGLLRAGGRSGGKAVDVMTDDRDVARGEFLCAFCARSNAVLIDRLAGARQAFDEVCEHCHQMNHVAVEFVPGVAAPRVTSRVERG